MGKNKNQNKLKKYLDKIEEIDYIKNMKAIKAIDQLIPYIITSVFIIAMFNLFMAFAGYVERNGL